MLCEPLEVFEGEIAEPLEVLPAQHAALLLPVFLLIELGVYVGVVQLSVGCASDDLTPEVVDVFRGYDDLQLVHELQLLLPPLVFDSRRNLLTSIMENLNVIACLNACQQVLRA